MQVVADLDRLYPRPANALLPTRQAIAAHLFFTCYMGTVNSSADTRARARAVAADIGCTHSEGDIDAVVESSVSWVTTLTGTRPTFESGARTENLALQNVQARVRMVQSYLAAQLLLAARGRSGALLVLGSANVDEGLRGFLTKYDCSAADINPIGGISKLDLRAFLYWGAGASALNYPALATVAAAAASPELVPASATAGGAQVSEEDMGFSFEELGAMGRLRKLQACGPVGMYVQLRRVWSSSKSAKAVAEKVRFHINQYIRSIGTLLSSICRFLDLRSQIKSGFSLLFCFVVIFSCTYVGQVVLPLLRHQPAQDDHYHALVPRGELQSRRQPVRLATVPLLRCLAPAVRHDRQAGGRGGGYCESAVQAVNRLTES